jgi:hypothetical protein
MDDKARRRLPRTGSWKQPPSGSSPTLPALAATAHRYRVVHRDLKPVHSMFTKAGATLLDLGPAECCEPPAGGPAGTPRGIEATPVPVWRGVDSLLVIQGEEWNHAFS